MDVRVRFAPSPTGYLHVGGVRAFLFNWLYARKHGGKLILRIDDTDVARSTPENCRKVIEDLKGLGFDWDEGPEVGGPYGPYSQSERLAIYAKHAKQLLDKDQAYYCFCSPELIGQKREAALKMGRPPIYDGTCARVPRAEAEARIKKGEKAGIRFRALPKSYVLKDVVRGDVEFKEGTVGDFFITRSPSESEQEVESGVGMPVYNFCCVIDDYLMKMTHIIRGEDHLSNTARQLMIYDAFGWETPVYAHTAMVLGADKQKLSKRNGDVSAHEYLKKGFLAEALINFLALLGWWPGKDFQPKSGHPEVLALDEMISQFELEGLQKSAAVFDLQKLEWMNGFYIRNLPVDEIAKRARPFFEDYKIASDEWYKKVIDVVRNEAVVLADLPRLSEVFLSDSLSINEEEKALLTTDPALRVADALENILESKSSDEISKEEVSSLIQEVGSRAQAKGKNLFMPIRLLVTGKAHGPELQNVMPLLGRERLLHRVREARRRASL